MHAFNYCTIYVHCMYTKHLWPSCIIEIPYIITLMFGSDFKLALDLALDYQ